MRFETADELDEEGRRLYEEYLTNNYNLMSYGIEKNIYHVICAGDWFFNARCCICGKPSETGNFEIKENKSPVCSDCGLKYATDEEIIKWRKKFTEPKEE